MKFSGGRAETGEPQTWLCHRLNTFGYCTGRILVGRLGKPSKGSVNDQIILGRFTVLSLASPCLAAFISALARCLDKTSVGKILASCGLLRLGFRLLLL